MKVTQQLQELERLAKQLGVKVSYDTTAGLVSGSGGLCRVHGAYRIIIDRRLKPGARVQLLLDALARFDTTDHDVAQPIRVLLDRVARPSAQPDEGHALPR